MLVCAGCLCVCVGGGGGGRACVRTSLELSQGARFCASKILLLLLL